MAANPDEVKDEFRSRVAKVVRPSEDETLTSKNAEIYRQWMKEGKMKDSSFKPFAKICGHSRSFAFQKEFNANGRE